ncbi:ATP-binding protein [Roseofilum casamattae]|uniref:histidine kinase n=1 Tax=Roseofilum casamattae BLCC-M143 TaxID=3022442 RepID=A0ABT7C018_9CYAN|nr:ATP-binding protein [Roseofilum casamattae]MDJ1184794.1 ATP-binding protein [Roseofilum casamattae BLCC-M143]
MENSITATGRENYHSEIADISASDDPQFHLCLPSSQEGLWEWNITKNRLFFNENWRKIFGFPEDRIPQNWHELEQLICPEDLATHRSALQAHLAGETEFYETTYRLRSPSLGYRWISVRGLLYRSPNGDRCAGSHADITQFKNTQEKESLLRLITDQIRHSLNLQTIWQTAVDRIQSLLDADRVLIYQFDRDWKGRVVVEKAIGDWGSTLGTVGEDNCFSQEYARLYAAGRVRAIHDIFQSDLDECHVAFLNRLNVRSNLIVPITISEELWGLLILHECKGFRIWTEEETSWLVYIAQQLAIAICQANLYDRSQHAVAVSEEKARELEKALMQLQQTQVQLIESEKNSSIGQLVAGIAHEINNPVSFVYGNIDFAKSYVEDLLELLKLYQNKFPNPGTEIEELSEAVDLEFLETDCEELLQSMKNGASRIREIVLFLRTFSHLDESQMKRVNLHEGIESTLMIINYRLQSNDKRPQIDLIRDYGTLPPVECYGSQINQVFMHLLVNAIEAIDALAERENNQRSPQISIQTELIEEDLIQAIITDNGIGMTDLIRKRLFTPFYSTKPVGKGKGLGLSLCHAIIVNHHQGSLHCESEPNQGTRFILKLPLHQRYSTS